MIPDGFHTHDGFYWRRLPDGSVRIIVAESAMGDAPVIREHILPENEWASVVCSVSDEGEDWDRWMEARRFHGLPDATHELVAYILDRQLKHLDRDVLRRLAERVRQ